MTAPKLQHVAEVSKLSGLDLIIKYAVLLSWMVYGAGLTRISGFLHTLTVPTEPSSYALPTVLSYGATTLFDLIKATIGSVIVLKLSEKESAPQLWKFFGWILPAILFGQQNYSFWLIGPILVRIWYVLFFLGATYTILFVLISTNSDEVPVGTQILGAIFLFFLVVEGAGFRGDLEAYEAMNAQPTVQFLLASDAVSGASRLGIPFSPSDAELTEPLNVVVVSETMFYVRIPRKVTASPSQNGVRLDLGGFSTVAIRRDKVMIASAH